MVLWLCLAVLTAGVLAAVLRPLLQPADAPRSPAEADAAVYRDQLTEIEAERKRGLIPDSEAEAARTEIARRLLGTAQQARPHAIPLPSSPGPDHSSRIAALAMAAATPLLAVGLYLLVGSPGTPGFPLAARLQAPVETARVSDLVARVEARLREHPEDGAGWDVIAPVYMKQARYREAADAFAKAAALLGQSVQRLAGFAEATVMASDGIVTEPARAAYETISKLEPARPEPRFWLALAQEQDGRLAEAAAAYEALLRDAGATASWRTAVAERLAAVRARLALPKDTPPADSAPRGPTADDISAAQAMTPEARTAFIDQMVAGLAARLKTDASDLAAWQRLIRAYSVLGRNGEALAALGDARRNLAAQPASLDELDRLARSLGLGS